MNRRRVRVTILLAWCAVVAVAMARHEFWRDEIRALSIATSARSLADLPGLLKDEGHPLLWYVLLWLGARVAPATFVLPALSVIVAACAVWLFVMCAPFPSWLTAMFVLGGLPAYEYSVMARNYGISMLLLFAFAWQYPQRHRHPVRLGVVLALLCNTNVHSVPLAILLLVFWAWDVFLRADAIERARRAAWFGAAAAIVLAGMVLAVSTVWPSGEATASDATRYTVANVREATIDAIENPAETFNDLVPSGPGLPAVAGSLLLVAAMIGLAAQPEALAAALLAMLTLSVLFEIVYPSAYRHEGLLVVFVLALYWIVLERDGADAAPPAIASRLMPIGLYGAMPILLGGLIVTGGLKWYRDVRYQESASRELGGFLRSRPAYASAVLIGEPDYALEAVPYYADNPIYVVREHQFSPVVHFVRGADANLTLGALLAAARDLAAREPRDVLVALGHLDQLDPEAPDAAGGTIHYSFGRTFSWSKADLREWQASTVLLGRFADGVVGDERFAVYRVNGAPAR